MEAIQGTVCTFYAIQAGNRHMAITLILGISEYHLRQRLTVMIQVNNLDIRD